MLSFKVTQVPLSSDILLLWGMSHLRSYSISLPSSPRYEPGRRTPTPGGRKLLAVLWEAPMLASMGGSGLVEGRSRKELCRDSEAIEGEKVIRKLSALHCCTLGHSPAPRMLLSLYPRLGMATNRGARQSPDGPPSSWRKRGSIVSQAEHCESRQPQPALVPLVLLHRPGDGAVCCSCGFYQYSDYLSLEIRRFGRTDGEGEEEVRELSDGPGEALEEGVLEGPVEGVQPVVGDGCGRRMIRDEMK